ncbi:ROK family protein [Paenibacillus chungangensis]|uniref:ROK family protein n=1 Tax=Paenibacillus chungangensis TaxID=696535 RepID=A0ABW3HKK1_9BACL
MSGKIAIGIDIGGTNIKAGAVNDKGEVVVRATLPTEAQRGGEALLARIVAISNELISSTEAKGFKCIGVGIGSAGQIDVKNGAVAGATSNLPGWAGIQVVSRLQEQINLPVVLDNDANALAYGEAWVGAGKGWRDFVCITLGTGIGGCFIHEGQPYHGHSGFAGEFGHHVIKYGGRSCNCGRSGCWEQYASVTALMKMVNEQAGDRLEEFPSAEVVFAKARNGDEFALRMVENYAEYIAAGLSNFIHIFNPNGIVIGGAVTAQGDFLFDRILHFVERSVMRVYNDEKNPIQILPALLGEDAGIVGSAAPLYSSVIR